MHVPRQLTSIMALTVEMALCHVKSGHTFCAESAYCSCYECCGCIPEDWNSSVVLPIYKGKGDPVECGSCRGVKLLEHAMKVVERISEYRIWQQIEISDTQF